MFTKLWKDEAGIVALEYLLVATIVGLGLVVGLATLAKGINNELVELANAIQGLSQAYSIASVSTCQALRQGSCVTDTAATFSIGSSLSGSAAVTCSSIDIAACS